MYNSLMMLLIILAVAACGIGFIYLTMLFKKACEAIRKDKTFVNILAFVLVFATYIVCCISIVGIIIGFVQKLN